MRQWLYILLLCVGCYSCNILWDKPPPTIDDQIIVDRAQERLNTYIRQKRETCFNNIIEEAEIHIDTTITNLIDQYIKDTTYFPPRPERPDRPDPLEVDSNFRPEPIFKDSLRTRIKMKRDTVVIKSDTLIGIIDTARVTIDTSGY
ncbi:MAG: hypothetical protein HKN68_07335 [Saprospiraceae bacterium]|nr:hypothetical protein [Saprospiraceae bacterium]